MALEDRKAQTLWTASVGFARKGYLFMLICDICYKLNSYGGTLYQNFKGNGGLFPQVIHRYLDAIQTPMIPADTARVPEDVGVEDLLLFLTDGTVGSTAPSPGQGPAEDPLHGDGHAEPRGGGPSGAGGRSLGQPDPDRSATPGGKGAQGPGGPGRGRAHRAGRRHQGEHRPHPQRDRRGDRRHRSVHRAGADPGDLGGGVGRSPGRMRAGILGAWNTLHGNRRRKMCGPGSA